MSTVQIMSPLQAQQELERLRKGNKPSEAPTTVGREPAPLQVGGTPPPIPGTAEWHRWMADKMANSGEAPPPPSQPTTAPQEKVDEEDLSALTKDAFRVQSADLTIPEPKKDPRLEHKFREIDGLPSNYLYYDFKALRIRPFVWQDQIDLAVCRGSGNLRFMLEVIGRCIDQPLQKLTLGDFAYICYWLRLNSYTKSPVVVTWKCASCAHENTTKLHHKTTEIVEIPDYIDLGEDFDIPRMGAYLEYQAASKDQMPELKAALDVAMWVRGDRLADKLDRLESAEDLQLFEGARSAMVALGAHGVKDVIEAKCGAFSPGGCGGVNRVRLEAPLLNFLSGL